jgi:hypothetical protein
VRVVTIVPLSPTGTQISVLAQVMPRRVWVVGEGWPLKVGLMVWAFVVLRIVPRSRTREADAQVWATDRIKAVALG